MQRYAARMSQLVCTCPPDQVCDGCLKQQLMWFAGVANARGHIWASSVAAQRPDLLDRPWPPLEGRAAVLAASKVVELSQDPRVRARLLDEVDAAARKRWEELRAGRGR
jgi:hypothetical protein